jgi:hypothetical protein
MVLMLVGLFTSLGLSAVVTAGAAVSGLRGAGIAFVTAGCVTSSFLLPIVAVEADAPKIFMVAAVILLVCGIYGGGRYFLSTAGDDSAAALAVGAYALAVAALVCASMGYYLVIVGGIVLAVATVPAALSLMFIDGSRVSATMRGLAALLAAAFWLFSVTLLVLFA